MPLDTPSIGAEMMIGSLVLGNHSCNLFLGSDRSGAILEVLMCVICVM